MEYTVCIVDPSTDELLAHYDTEVDHLIFEVWSTDSMRQRDSRPMFAVCTCDECGALSK